MLDDCNYTDSVKYNCWVRQMVSITKNRVKIWPSGKNFNKLFPDSILEITSKGLISEEPFWIECVTTLRCRVYSSASCYISYQAVETYHTKNIGYFSRNCQWCFFQNTRWFSATRRKMYYGNIPAGRLPSTEANVGWFLPGIWQNKYVSVRYFR